MRYGIPLFLFAAAGLLAPPPAAAQADLSGYWANRPHEDNLARGPGLLVGEYAGFPINVASRTKAESWNATVVANRERQCIPFGIMTANSSFRITREVDTITQQDLAWKIHIDYASQDRTVWMDGRPHPPAHAPHTWQGFSTGRWENNQLVVTTTHLKTSVIERNGNPRSDRATTVEHFIRRGDIMTVVHVTYDPVWLEEPLMQTRDFALDTNGRSPASVCVPADEVAARRRGYVPHYLPGRNPLILESAAQMGVPPDAFAGGAATMYPEYQATLRRLSPDKRTVENRPQDNRATAVPAAVRPPDLAADAVAVLPVQGRVHMLATTAGNIAVQASDHSVIVVDTQTGALSDKLLAAIRGVSDKPIRYVINTSARPDHTGGNEAIAKAGRAFSQTEGGGGGNQNPGLAPQGAAIVAHENVLERLSAPTGQKSAVPFAAWPTETYVAADYRLFNGEAVHILHQPAAATDGDSVVFFQRSDVIASGDIYNTDRYPVIDRDSGGSINGVVAALNNLVDLMTVAVRQEGGTYVIPGHGRISDQADVVEYCDMVVILRDRIQDMVKRGMTLDQVRRAQPTLDYDGLYAAPGSSWTKDMFVEAVYRDLSGGTSTN